MAELHTDSTERSSRRPLWPALLCVLLVLLAVAWVAGRQSLQGAPDQPTSLDAIRLGPDPGEPVEGYLAGLPARLPPAGAPAVPALVQFGALPDGVAAARLLTGVTPATAVFRVPLPRVQTALRFQPLPPVDAPDPVAAAPRRFTLAQQAAQRDASVQASRLTGRPASVAGYEAAALAAEPPCRCMLAVLVVGDRPALTRLAGLPEVRAVDAAPEGTPVTGVALAPLLPEQTQVAGPAPDDGPVPAAPGGPGNRGANPNGTGR
ncbi:MAG TPA: hypothetical protein VGD73_19890 [Pseudonocardia sp.]|jgi:hypothetical protein|uniref:hypothetical protein n=1 Tax=Pseudonocardia sp. TaxID=60912 RepID=UPI002EDA0AF8